MPKPEKPSTQCVHLRNGHTCKHPELAKGVAVTSVCLQETPLHDPRIQPGCLLQEPAIGTVQPAFGPQPTRPR